MGKTTLFIWREEDWGTDYGLPCSEIRTKHIPRIGETIYVFADDTKEPIHGEVLNVHYDYGNDGRLVDSGICVVILPSKAVINDNIDDL